ncbi:tyrosyl-DNA phosphodiesterase-domain-containing protein [Paraphoma chrysanthemicola]|nr:tyrosyl-DNA phosphodiesterase-domain-containing protein [Paraphoma chrysanthemicola]
MTRHSILPPHVDPSLRDVNDLFLGIGGIGYTICYVLMTRKSIQDCTYAMPLFSLAFNFAWEIIFALFVAVETREVTMFTIWMLIDLGLVYAVLKYGANEWKTAPLVGENIGKLFAIMLAWWCLILYAISVWWLDPSNPVNPKAGKSYQGIDGLDTDELGYWTALVAQVVLSGMSLAQIVIRGSSRGSSYAIWTTRFVGSLSGLNLNYGYCWWVWPEAHGYVASPVAVVMMATWVLADLAYLAVLFGLRHSDLERAIALSLQQSPRSAHSANGKAIDLTSDTEDEDEDEDDQIARAIALSLSQTGPTGHALNNHSPPRVGDVSSNDTVDALQLTGLAGLDRQAMEQERLARLGKRKRDPSPDRPSKQIAKSSTTNRVQTPSSLSLAPSEEVHIFPRGTIKRTFAAKFPRTNDITIDELLQADTVNIAVISSFQWDSEWLNKKIDPRKVKQIWIMNAKDRDTQDRWRQEAQECSIPNLKIHFPPMGGQIHAMHSKFMLLFGTDRLRLIVPTANMTPIDWGEVKNDWQPGVMENSVFLIDLPRRSDGVPAEKDMLPSFGRDFVYFLERQEVGQKVIEGVLKFDFSQTDHLAFVHSIGGTYQGEPEQNTGLPGLRQAICDLRLGDVQEMQLDYAASSLGAINDNLLQRIWLAARGEPFTTSTKISNVRDAMRIYFPTDETIQKSIGGPDCGGIISLGRQHYKAASFPRDCLRDYDSTRRGMLSHNKLLFARGVKTDGTPFAWVYVGSANISESAWGAQKVLKSGKMGSLVVRNWECGVVVPVSQAQMVGAGVRDGAVPPMSVFEGTIEVPFVCPGQRYGTRQPWLLRAIHTLKTALPSPCLAAAATAAPLCDSAPDDRRTCPTPMPENVARPQRPPGDSRAAASTSSTKAAGSIRVGESNISVPFHSWFTSPARSHPNAAQAKELPLHLIQLILTHVCRPHPMHAPCLPMTSCTRADHGTATTSSTMPPTSRASRARRASSTT